MYACVCMYSLTHSLLTHSLTHTRSFPPSLPPSLPFPAFLQDWSRPSRRWRRLTHCSLTHPSLTHSLTHTRSLPPSLTHSLTPSHSLLPSLTPSFPSPLFCKIGVDHQGDTHSLLTHSFPRLESTIKEMAEAAEAKGQRAMGGCGG